MERTDEQVKEAVNMEVEETDQENERTSTSFVDIQFHLEKRDKNHKNMRGVLEKRFHSDPKIAVPAITSYNKNMERVMLWFQP